MASTCLCAKRQHARGARGEDGKVSAGVFWRGMEHVAKVEERGGIVSVCVNRFYKQSGSRQLAMKTEARALSRQAGVDKRSLLIVNLFVDLCPIYLPLS